MKLDLKELLNKLTQSNGVMLFDNDNQSMSGAITLSESASNFDRLTICFKSNDGDYGSQDVCHPDGKKVSLMCDRVAEDSAHWHWIKAKTVQVNGTQIDTIGSTYYATGQVSLSSGVTLYYGDYIAITQVIGYKN